MVDLLLDREAATLAAWLRDHPGAEVIARDRTGAYAEGARRGAPDDVQVAKRWHLLRNLTDALQLVVDRNRHRLCDAAQTAAERPWGGAAPGGPSRSSGWHRWQGRRFAEDGRLSAGCAVRDQRMARRLAHRSARIRKMGR